MKRRIFIVTAWIAYALSWFLPVHKDGVTLPDGLPGYEAFRVAFAHVWPYEGLGGDTWYNAVLASLSAATNLTMLISIWVAWRPSPRRARGLLWVALASFLLNAQWALGRGRDVLRPGYFLWWLSFMVLAIAAWRLERGDSPERRSDAIERR